MATINPKTGKTNAQVLAESTAVANQARALIGGGTSAKTSSASNPHDAPGYNPATDPTSSVYKANLNAPTQPIAETPTTPVDTSQPTPQSPQAQITPPNAQFDTTNLVNAYKQKGGPLTTAEVGAPQDLAAQYRQGLATAKANATQVPTSQGAAATGIQANLPQPQTESPSIVGGIMETDSNFDSILTMYDDFMSPVTQKVSLLDEYNQTSQSLGISGMNAELINAKRIIEGTEDDIRSEVTATGGMATDSQVLAMANARNKSLVKNYNYLLESRDNAMTQLNTMMNLSIQDRQMAEAEFDRKLNFAFKVQEFQQKAVENSRTNYNNIVSTVGYEGLLAATNGNAYEQSLIEKTLGLGQGGLQRMASLPPPPLTEMEQADLAYKKAQTSKLYSDIKTQENKDTTKPPTQAQLQVAGYRDRLLESNQIINSVGGQFTGSFDFGGSMPGPLQSEARQSYEQAKRNFINSVLRRESGAAISPSEFDNAEKQYFPQRGDKPLVVQQKAANRQTVINSFSRESSSVASLNVVTGPDGQEYEVIN